MAFRRMFPGSEIPLPDQGMGPMLNPPGMPQWGPMQPGLDKGPFMPQAPSPYAGAPMDGPNMLEGASSEPKVPGSASGGSFGKGLDFAKLMGGFGTRRRNPAATMGAMTGAASKVKGMF